MQPGWGQGGHGSCPLAQAPAGEADPRTEQGGCRPGLGVPLRTPPPASRGLPLHASVSRLGQEPEDSVPSWLGGLHGRRVQGAVNAGVPSGSAVPPGSARPGRLLVREGCT